MTKLTFEEVYEKIPNQFRDQVKLIEYEDYKKVLLNTKHDLIKMTVCNLQKLETIDIRSALNKTEFFTRMMLEKYPDYEKEFIITGEYKNNNDKIEVTDGYFIFQIRPRHLLMGVKPSIQSVNDPTQYTISLIKDVHGNQYGYNNYEYKGASYKSTINCPVHGDFKQTFSHHISGRGCKKCGNIKTGNSSRSNSKDFINKSNIVHNSFYKYPDTIYIDCKTLVDIECPIHGNFQQIPNSHLQGCGCLKCALESFKGGYKKQDFIKIANNRSCILYLLKMFNDKELFYKIGITSLTVEERFINKSKMPYIYESIYEYICDAGCVWDLEKKLHKKYKSFKYIPVYYFGGYTECFNMSLPITEIIENLKNNS